MSRFLPTILGLIVLNPAFGKCPNKLYVVAGWIESENAPLADAAVGVSYTSQFDGLVIKQAHSDKDGYFEIPILFYPFDGMEFSGRHKCGAQLERVELVISRAGYEPKSQVLPPTPALPSGEPAKKMRITLSEKSAGGCAGLTSCVLRRAL